MDQSCCPYSLYRFHGIVAGGLGSGCCTNKSGDRLAPRCNTLICKALSGRSSKSESAPQARFRNANASGRKRAAVASCTALGRALPANDTEIHHDVCSTRSMPLPRRLFQKPIMQICWTQSHLFHCPSPASTCTTQRFAVVQSLDCDYAARLQMSTREQHDARREHVNRDRYFSMR